MGIGDDKSIHREDTKAKDCGLRIADCKLQIADCRLQIETAAQSF
jgi:hypothetical protein